MSNPQYGNSIRVGSLRIGGWLPVRSFVIGLGTVVATMMIILLGYLIPGLVFLLGMFLGLAIFGIPFGDADLTLAARILRSLRHARHVSTGEATFVNSHFSGRTSEELLGLPGYLHTINTVNSIDGTGAPVQLLHHKSVGMASVTLACAPIGTNMQPQDSTTHQVGSFANWLGSLASEGGLRGASVTVDSILESSLPMAEAIMDTVDARSPQVAQQILREAAAALPARVSKVTSYVTLGWRLSSLDDDIDGALAEIVSRIPRHMSALSASGAGQIHAMSDAEYGDMMYTAYNPHRTGEVERELHYGIDAVRTFAGSGPEYTDATDKRVVLHDGVASMTVMMTVPDPSKITERSYERLFAPSRHFLRKRVTMFYRPIPVSAQRTRIDSASRNSTTENTSRKRVTVFETKKAKAIGHTMDQMSRGAMIHEWALMITVTFEPNRKAKRAAENELKGLMGGMRWTFADYAADAAFHQTLPIGLFPWVYSSRPWLFNPEYTNQKGSAKTKGGSSSSARAQEGDGA